MKFKLVLTALALLASPHLFADTCPAGTVYDTDASIFESNNPAPAPASGLWPITGGGISNGHFAICEHAGVQIGGRIIERGVGQITPDAGTADYHAPIGGPGDGTALWNIEGHIDLGYLYGAGVSPLSFADLTYSVVLDCNPFIDIIDGPTLPFTGFPPDNTILFQFSQNLGFGALCANYGAGFDPTADGLYTLSVEVNDANGTVLAALTVNAIVGNPIMAPKISAVGIIESQSEGFKFPDGTIQTTAATSSPPPPAHPSTYINSANTDNPPGGELAFVACDAGDEIIGGGGRCRAGSLFDAMHKSCPADANGACLDNGGTNFETWAVQCDSNSRSFAYAVCLDITP